MVDAYKTAVVKATEKDIVLTECVTGIPVSVILTPYIKRLGLKAGFFARWMLRSSKMKHLMRMFYALKSIYQLKKAIKDETGRRDYWQAGKSVAGVDKVESVSDVIKRFSSYVLENYIK